MIRRFLARKGLLSSRAAMLTVSSVLGVAAIVSSAEARPVSPSTSHVASSVTTAGPGIFVPTLWHAPAYHAPIRLQAARLAARAEMAADGIYDVPPIDWRVLAGLDYLTGKVSDTLKALSGKEVRIPGFVVPLDDFMEDGAEFLLVPYYGACVHTPPPPPNQIIFVQMANKKSVKLTLFDAVWMHGKLKIATVESPYGTVGFTLEGTKMEPYSSR